MTQDRVKKIARNVIKLPTLPTIVAKIIELVEDPNTSASTLGKLISSDQVFTAKILKLANSAFYGFPRKISTVTLAIVVLGFETLKNLGLSVSVIERFSKISANGYFDMTLFWEHSIGCGVASKMLARDFSYRISGEVFVAGLLHDIGKLVINQYLKSEFEEVVGLVKEEDILFIEAEERVMKGITHADVGGWLADRWNLPPQLVDAITYHHHPERCVRHPKVASIVHFADALCRKAGIGSSGDKGIIKLNPAVPEILELERDPLGEINYGFYLERLRQELKKAETFINILKEEESSEDG